MSRRSDPERIAIGKIIGVHGIRGTMRIYPLTDYPERFFDMESLHITLPGGAERDLAVDNIRAHEGKGVLLFISPDVTSREAAEALRGSLITVGIDDRVSLGKDEYWIDDIVGIEVMNLENGELLGKVEGVMETGSNDVYEVRKCDGSLGMIPAIAEVVESVDIEAGKIFVRLPEGLWD